MFNKKHSTKKLMLLALGLVMIAPQSFAASCGFAVFNSGFRATSKDVSIASIIGNGETITIRGYNLAGWRPGAPNPTLIESTIQVAQGSVTGAWGGATRNPGRITSVNITSPTTMEIQGIKYSATGNISEAKETLTIAGGQFRGGGGFDSPNINSFYPTDSTVFVFSGLSSAGTPSTANFQLECPPVAQVPPENIVPTIMGLILED